MFQRANKPFAAARTALHSAKRSLQRCKEKLAFGQKKFCWTSRSIGKKFAVPGENARTLVPNKESSWFVRLPKDHFYLQINKRACFRCDELRCGQKDHLSRVFCKETFATAKKFLQNARITLQCKPHKLHMLCSSMCTL